MINNFLLSDTTFHRSMCTHGAFNFLPLKKIIIIYLSYLLGHTCDKAVYHLLTATFLKNVLDAALDQFREKKRSIYDYCFTYFRQWLLIFLVFFAQLINQLSSAPLLYCFFRFYFYFSLSSIMWKTLCESVFIMIFLSWCLATCFHEYTDFIQSIYTS
jgi:hypothetical protein